MVNSGRFSAEAGFQEVEGRRRCLVDTRKSSSETPEGFLQPQKDFFNPEIILQSKSSFLMYQIVAAQHYQRDSIDFTLRYCRQSRHNGQLLAFFCFKDILVSQIYLALFCSSPNYSASLNFDFNRFLFLLIFESSLFYHFPFQKQVRQRREEEPTRSRILFQQVINGLDRLS